MLTGKMFYQHVQAVLNPAEQTYHQGQQAKASFLNVYVVQPRKNYAWPEH
jgi:hypothetical protein